MIVPKARSENVISTQDHFQIIVVQFVNTILPLLEMYLQQIFETNESFFDKVGNGGWIDGKKEVLKVFEDAGIAAARSF